MTYHRPPTLPNYGDILDVRQLNDVFVWAADAISGGLDETVWSGDFVNLDGVVEAGAWCRFFVCDEPATVTSARVLAPQTYFDTVPYSFTWRAVDKYDLVITSRGAKTLLIFWGGVSNRPTSGNQDYPGIMLGIEVDGVLQPDSVFGSGDWGNDRQEETAGTTGTINGQGVDWTFLSGTGPGYRGRWCPYRLTSLVDLSPGEHTVRLVYRNISRGYAPSQYIDAGGSVAMEIWA